MTPLLTWLLMVALGVPVAIVATALSLRRADPGDWDSIVSRHLPSPVPAVGPLRMATGLALWMAILTAGCGSTAGPTTPDVTTYPQLTADTTASTNLKAVVELERAAGRQGRLVAVSGLVNRRGHLASSGPWYYTFREPDDVAGAVHQWRVDAQGVVTHEHFGMCGLFFSEHLTGGVGLDSDRVIDLALQEGGQDFVTKYPGDDTFGLVYGMAQAYVFFITPACYRPSLTLNRLTGVVTDTSNLNCSGVFRRPCGGPGAF